MKSSPRTILACLSLFFSAHVANAANESNLVAQWSFNKNLTADWGGFDLYEMDWGSDAQMTQRDGLAHLGGGRLLVTHELNSKQFAKLSDSVTIWARMRLDATPAQTCFLMGFRNESDPSEWKDMRMALFFDPRNGGGLGFYSILKNGDQFASGPSSMAPVKAGEFFTVALVFDGPSGGRETIVNGKLINREAKQPAKALGDFTNFAIGRLMKHSAVAITVDEVRVYGAALSLSEISRIEAEFKE